MRDDTRHKSWDISTLRARTHALACGLRVIVLHRGTAPSDAAQWLTPHSANARFQHHLPTAELQVPRDRPKRLAMAREERGQDSFSTVNVAHIDEVVEHSASHVASSRPT